MASLPQPSDHDLDMSGESETHLAAMSEDASSNHDDSPPTSASSEEPLLAPEYEEVPVVNINKDNMTTEVTEPSASEEELQEAVSEQK